MGDCVRSMERATPDSTPRTKFDNDEVNNLLGPKKVPSVSTPQRVGGGTTTHQQALHPQGGKQLHGGILHHGMSDLFYNRTQGVHKTPSPRGMSFSCRKITSHLFFLMHLAHVITLTSRLNGLSAHFTPSTCHP